MKTEACKYDVGRAWGLWGAEKWEEEKHIRTCVIGIH